MEVLVGCTVILLASGILGLLGLVGFHDHRLDKLEKRVEALEKQPPGYVPASYEYLNDVNQWLNQKGR
jgi:hypothetical protein